ncbi:circularly permuted type 2 ATP-grasp protein [Gryllotalpicola koreensis]|uniref:Circularly permuted type 2 ATP-grasp protein n=1 Tax=Gryllotalpicola koreensis TaxID=993086 RepID=A0ABP8A3R8_9MICO
MSILRDYAAALTQPTLPFAGGVDRATRFDEVIDPDGSLRTPWKRLADAAARLTPDALDRVEDEIARFIADDGVLYASEGTRPRPWRLDPVPLVIDAASWAKLEVGLAQRAELLNALLVDLYGERRMLAAGLIPPAAVFGHGGFTRAAALPPGAAAPAAPRPLMIVGTDLGRDAQGEWRVVGDRVQAPSGLGYAVENRRVISRVLPELYREAELHRLEPYYTALRETLLNAAPEDAREPLVVVLSPGTLSETAYDQASLANLLGFPLVQGDDLVVRDGAVWVKPAGWPRTAPRERVDVILRRVDPDWCDPLELRGDSQLGVAGLVEAVRRGSVRLVNGLGSGVLENPALHAFMPAVCEALLGEQLRLPSAPAWWGGDAAALDGLLARLSDGDESLDLRRLDGSRAGAGSTPRQKAALLAADPRGHVAIERLPLSQGPVWSAGGEATPQPLVLRTFTVDYHSAYRPLFGGIATVSGRAAANLISKDVWVLKADAEDADQGLAAAAPLPAVASVPLPAPRALDDMFWAGRYAERTEDLLRIVLEAHVRLTPPSPLAPAFAGVGAAELMSALQRLAGRWQDNPEDELRSVLLDDERPGSAAHSLGRMREALEGVRDQLSGDTWRLFGSSERALRALRDERRSRQIAETTEQLLTGILAFQGVTASMMRDSAWHMIEAGRYLERALQLCALLSAALAPASARELDRPVLEAVLTAAESAVTYRRRYRGRARTQGVLELLLAAPDNPRSLLFALTRLRFHLERLPLSTGSTRPERLVDELRGAVEALDARELVVAQGEGRPALDGFLGEASVALMQISDAITALHLTGGPPRLPLAARSFVEVMG